MKEVFMNEKSQMLVMISMATDKTPPPKNVEQLIQ
jgi:hypothetical protein